MTTGLIDLASMHSALVAVSLGKHRPWPRWNTQSLIEVTHLLLRDDIRVLPGMRGGGNADELYQIVLKYFHQLEFQARSRKSAQQKTIQWMRDDLEAANEAWDKAQEDEDLDAWLDLQRHFFWAAHVRRHKALFDKEFIPYIAPMLGCGEDHLNKVHSLSSDVQIVEEWRRTDLSSPEAKLANSAWVLSGLVRGKFYEFLGSRKHVLLHPFRRHLKYAVEGEETLPITNSEAYIIEIIIGSALLEKDEDARVNKWASNIDLVRRTVPRDDKGFLHQHDKDEDAEWYAYEVAKKIGIPTSSKRVEKYLKLATSLGIKAASFLTVDFWMPGASLAAEKAYELRKGTSLSGDIATKLLLTKSQYKRLADLGAGKIRYSHSIKSLSNKL